MFLNIHKELEINVRVLKLDETFDWDASTAEHHSHAHLLPFEAIP